MSKAIRRSFRNRWWRRWNAIHYPKIVADNERAIFEQTATVARLIPIIKARAIVVHALGRTDHSYGTTACGIGITPTWSEIESGIDEVFVADLTGRDQNGHVYYAQIGALANCEECLR